MSKIPKPPVKKINPNVRPKAGEKGPDGGLHPYWSNWQCKHADYKWETGSPTKVSNDTAPAN